MKTIRPYKPTCLHVIDGVPSPKISTECSHLDLEIGCGVGYHPIKYAQQHTDRFLVAIEHTAEKFEKFKRRLLHHDPFPNLMAVHDNAITWVERHVAPESLDRVIFMYPNPNPKPGHFNRRWHGMPFMELLIDMLKSGGEVLLATNEEFYVEEAKEYMEHYWKLTALYHKAHSSPDQVPFNGRTHFEKKYLQRGETCFESMWRKP